MAIRDGVFYAEGLRGLKRHRQNWRRSHPEQFQAEEERDAAELESEERRDGVDRW